MRVLFKLPPRSIDNTISITELMLQQYLLLHSLLPINENINIYIFMIYFPL